MKEQIRTHVGMAQTHPHQGGPLSLISCVSGREASPLDDNDSGGPVEMKTETKKKRFHPLRNLRRMFRRKSRRSSVSNESYKPETGDGGLQPATNLDQRSRSTGRLLEDESSQNRSRKDGLAPGLSLSHDSVFAADRADSGHSSSDLENSSLSIPISVPGVRFRAELADAVRRRNRESDEEEEEDLGLPRSPCSSPTTADALGEKPRELVVKSQSSCSEGSLPSMESSDAELDPPNSKSDFDLSVESQKLSHSAAKHKMAVRPKRNHGAPRGKRTRKSGTALPATPEANEETVVENRFSPEVSTPVCEESPVKKSSEEGFRMVDPRKKSASLPHGAALSSSPKVTRSRSNVVAGISGAAPFRKRNSSEAEDDPAEGNEEQIKMEGKKDESFFGRLLPRRSGKKKKSDLELEKDAESSKEDLSEEDKSGTLFSKKIPKSHPKNPERRQRVEPLDVSAGFPGSEVNDLTRNRMKLSYSVSPPRNPWPTRAVSRSISPPETVWPERCFPLSDETDGDDLKNARRNAYESSWEENVRKIGGRTSPAGRFLKNESSSAKRTRREISPVKARRESSPSRLHAEPTPAVLDKPPIQKSQSFRNFSTDSFSGKEKPFAPFKVEETKEDPKRFRKEERTSAPLPFPRKSASLESVGSVRIESVTGKSSSSENFPSPFPGAGFVITHEEPEYANLEKVLPVLDTFDKVHHGYENIQIIELVRKEARTKSLTEGIVAETEIKKPAKPPVFEKPNAVPEFMRVQLNKVESRNSVPSEKTETAAPEIVARNRPKSTLIERRKSELLLTSESEEKNFKPKVVSVQKQTVSPVKKPEEPEKPEKPKPKTVLNQKSTENEPESEVVLRKKPAVAHKEDQPELMKVFARRSLKIKEDEVLSDDSRKSRDSDKENEIAESPKEERKRLVKTEPKPEPEKKCEIPEKPEILRKSKTVERLVVDVTPLKPAAVARNSVFRKYGRACSESAIEKPAAIETSPPPEQKTPEPESESAEESGFKRIQQRKAEWEKRMQQAAKQ